MVKAQPPSGEVRKTKLANGVRVITETIPVARSVSMGVWVAAGARDESENEAGLSHFIEHMIFKGTRRRTAFDIAREFDAIGGLTNAFTSLETTCYHGRVLDTHLPVMVDILSDIFIHSRFDEEEMDRERPVILQEIGMVEDTPDEWVHTLHGQTVWGEDPLGRNILGTREHVMGFEARDVRAFFQRLYRPDRICVTLAGKLDPDRVLDLVGPLFESVEPQGPGQRRLRPDCLWRAAVHARDIEQTHVILSVPGLSITDPDRFTLSVLNTILGGNMSSRLFQEIREKEGLAYSVYSFVNAYEDTGMLGACAAVAPENAPRCLELITGQMARLKAQPVSAWELEGAKEFTRGSFLLASESVDNQMVRLAQNEIYFHRHISVEEVLDAVDRVTREDVLSLAGRLFESGRAAVTVLGGGVDKGVCQAIVDGMD